MRYTLLARTCIWQRRRATEKSADFVEGILKIRRKDERIAKKLTRRQLQRENNCDDQGVDLFSNNHASRRRNLFLGFYSKAGIHLALTQYGFFNDLKKRGFHDVNLSVDATDPFVHRVTLHDGKTHKDRLLAELVARRETLRIHLPFHHRLQGRAFEVFKVEWLCMQNPSKPFTKERPQLPGQTYPSLGLARRVLELAVMACRRLALSGIINIPAYYHNAWLFSRLFHYINPIKEAYLNALKRDLSDLSLSHASWAVDWQCVLEKDTGKPFEWMRGPQLATLAPEMESLFKSPEYVEFVNGIAQSLSFRLDRPTFQRRLETQGH